MSYDKDNRHRNAGMTFHSGTAIPVTGSTEDNNYPKTLIDAITGSGYGTSIQSTIIDDGYYSDIHKTIDNLFEVDYSESSVFYVTAQDGTYTWNGSSWVHQ